MLRTFNFKHLLALLLICHVFASVQAVNPGLSTAAPIAKTSCPAPPPTSFAISSTTSNSIGLIWTSGLSGLTFRLRGTDITTSTPLPTIYTTGFSHTYTSLPQGHIFDFDIAASECGDDGEFGEIIQLRGSTWIIVVDDIVDFPHPCGMDVNEETITNGSVFDFCVNASTMAPDHSENPKMGQFNFNAGGGNTFTYKFGLAYVSPQIFVGQYSPQGQEPLTSFPITNVAGGKQAQIKYSNGSTTVELFRVDIPEILGPVDPNLVHLLLTFGPGCANGACTNFFHCPWTCESGGSGGRSSSDGAADAEITADYAFLLPNPFTQSAMVRYTKSAGPVHIELFSVTGQLIQTLESLPWQDAGTYEALIDGSSLQRGLYLVGIQTSKGRKMMQLVKQD